MFTSNAEWDKRVYYAGISTDTHETLEQAQAVCRMLERDGFGGEGKAFPIRTWT